MADYFNVYYNDVNKVVISGADLQDENDPTDVVTNRSCTYNQNGEFDSRCNFDIDSIDFFASRDKGSVLIGLPF